MKTARCFVSLFALLFCTVTYSTVRAADGVPQAVLNVRQSVLRVLCQTNDTLYTGSGFAIGAEEPVQFIVTNLHVVTPNVNGITILRENNREIPAKVYLRVENADLCVLLLDESLYGVPPLALSDADEAAVGQAVFALGFPGAADILADTATGNSEDVTVTDGIISAVKSFTYVENGTPISLLQINAAINPGNSGGPLADDKGHILGINSLGVQDAQSVNGAVSIRELTGALKARGITYLSVSDKADFPLLLVVGIGGAFVLLCAVTLVIILVRRSKRKQPTQAPAIPLPSMPLPAYMQHWGGKLPYDMAARLLAPVLATLSAMHTAGRMHGDICPEAITVNPNSVQAALSAPESASAGGRLVLHPGFSAPEQYRADGRLGLWSDVYSACAVFFYVITGKAPQEVMERMGQGESDLSFSNAIIEANYAEVLLAGLQLDAAKRPQNAMELVSTLGITSMETAHMPEAVPATSVPASAAAIAKPAKKKMKKGKRLLIVALVSLAVLCAGAGGYYLYNDYMYGRALECINKQDYKGGIDNLSNVLRVFKSSEQWMKYTSAGYALQQNDFNTARTLFTELEDFQKSKEMLKEVDYLNAHYLLTKQEYSQAKTLFTALGTYKDSKNMILESDYQQAHSYLSQKDFLNASKLFISLNEYKNSKTMILETDYQNGLSYIEEKQYKKASSIFKSLSDSMYKDSDVYYYDSLYLYGIDCYKVDDLFNAYDCMLKITGYKDASQYLLSLTDEIYNRAISYYKSSSYDECKQYLEKIGEYKDSGAYLILVAGHQATEFAQYADFSATKALYNRIKDLGYFEDAFILRESNAFLEFRLEGTWRGSGYYFKLYRTSEGWRSEYTLPWYNGDYYTLKDCTYFTGSESKTDKKQFSFYFVSENKMEVYCYKNGRTYTLTR